MTWYSASLLFVAKVLEGEQEAFPVSEEVYLLNAAGDELAWRMAEQIGRKDAEINGFTEIKGSLARREFIGIRKLRSIYNPPSMDDIDKLPPVHGTEITRSNFEVIGVNRLDDLRSGRPVDILYVDGAV